jgi:uncharacterized membrane protein
MSFTTTMEHIAQGFEVVGAAILVLGFAWSGLLCGRVLMITHDGQRGYRALRETFGGAILMGLEVLVAADLIRTVAVAPTMENVLILAVIVVIRIMLSFSLEVEIEGVAPWRRAQVFGAEAIVRGTRRALSPGEVRPPGPQPPSPRA